jgi:hypothetical protein
MPAAPVGERLLCAGVPVSTIGLTPPVTVIVPCTAETPICRVDLRTEADRDDDVVDDALKPPTRISPAFTDVETWKLIVPVASSPPSTAGAGRRRQRHGDAGRRHRTGRSPSRRFAGRLPSGSGRCDQQRREDAQNGSLSFSCSRDDRVAVGVILNAIVGV